MQNKKKCYNKIYCSFSEDAKRLQRIVKRVFYRLFKKNEKIRAKHLKRTAKKS